MQNDPMDGNVIKLRILSHCPRLSYPHPNPLPEGEGAKTKVSWVSLTVPSPSGRGLEVRDLA